MRAKYFLNMISELRQHEAIMLYGNLLQVSAEEGEDISNFLEEEYEKESLEYPYEAPPFDPAAALWAAKFIYFSAQLMLYREQEERELENILEDFPGPMNPSSILSADLCLRFIPPMITQLKLIDPEDPLVNILERQLKQWHYSGVAYELPVDELALEQAVADPCLHQLYCNRIIEHKQIKLALHPHFRERIQANLGIYAADFWHDFTLELKQ